MWKILMEEFGALLKLLGIILLLVLPGLGLLSMFYFAKEFAKAFGL